MVGNASNRVSTFDVSTNRVIGLADEAGTMFVSPEQLRADFEQWVTPLRSPSRITFSIELPFEMTPTEDEVALFTIVDSNADGKTWGYKTNFKGLVSPSNSKLDCDDWAILPGVRFDSVDNNYELSFEMINNMRGAAFASDFEFWIGTSNSVDAMTTKIGEIKGFYSADKTVATPQSIKFGIPGAAGTYYIGMRCVTLADHTLADGTEVSSWPTTFNKIALKQIDSSAAAPAKVDNLTVTPGEKGALNAQVSFNLPTTAMNGSALSASTTLTAEVRSSVETKTVSGAPGSAQSVTIATVQGDNTITVTVSSNVTGDSLDATVYTGEALPMRVHNLTGVLSRDNMTYSLSWTAPTEGENGGYVDFDNLEYDIYLYDQTKADYDYLTTVGKNLSYTYQAAEGEQLRTVRLGVFAHSSAGVSQDRVNWYDEDPVYVSDMVGTPYALPAVETFDNLNMKYTPLTIMRPDGYSGRWYIGDPSECVADANQSALICYNPYDEDSTMGRVALPKFSTKGIHNASFSVTAMLYKSYATTMTVYALNYDEEPTKLGDIDCNADDGWGTYDFPLPEQFQNKEWVQIYIDVDLADVDYVYAIDGYSLQQSADNDLTVTDITGSKAPRLGESNYYTAEVSNIGFNEGSFTGRFTVAVDGSIVATANTDAATVAAGEQTYISYKFTPTADMIGKTVTVAYEVIPTTTDEVAANNSKTITVEVRRGDLPTVLDLSAASWATGVHLKWNAPQTNKLMNESFESLTAFSYDSDLAGFTNVDGDGQPVYRFSSVSMPNEGVAKAFMVVNTTQLSSTEGLEANSGAQYLMATCPDVNTIGSSVAADDWLISPEIVGGEYVSFYLNIINAKYPESVEVMYSTGGTAAADFQRLDSFTVSKQGWSFYEYKLPADARRFALHYVSTDMFGIMVDDIAYTSATEQYTVTGYNVYRNGTLLATTTDTNYTDTTAQLGTTYSYNVTALTPTEGVKSNTAKILFEESGLNSVATDATAAERVYYTLQGVEVPANHLTPGIYICRQGNKVAKVVVR